MVRKVVDPDNPPLTDADLASMRPARDVLPPEVLASFKRKPGQRGPGKKPSKTLVTLRVDPDVLAAFQAAGDGWRAAMNATLRANMPGGKQAKRKAGAA